LNAEKKQEIINQIISLLEQNNMTLRQAQEVLMKTIKQIHKTRDEGKVSKEVDEKCPYLNQNNYCIVTRAGAGCRLAYCSNENHIKCADFHKAEDWNCADDN